MQLRGARAPREGSVGPRTPGAPVTHPPARAAKLARACTPHRDRGRTRSLGGLELPPASARARGPGVARRLAGVAGSAHRRLELDGGWRDPPPQSSARARGTQSKRRKPTWRSGRIAFVHLFLHHGQGNPASNGRAREPCAWPRSIRLGKFFRRILFFQTVPLFY